MQNFKMLVVAEGNVIYTIKFTETTWDKAFEYALDCSKVNNYKLLGVCLASYTLTDNLS
jgi:hypothetical protein